MNIFNWVFDLFGGGSESSTQTQLFCNSHSSELFSSSSESTAINPANGLPMIDGVSGVDIEGNPYGLDSSHDHWSTSNFDHYGSTDFGSTDSWNTDSFGSWPD